MECGMQMQSHSRTRLLLLLTEECAQTTASDLDDLKTNTWNVTDSVTTSSKTRNKHFVIFVDEVRAIILVDESRNLLTILDELYAAALTNSGVGLLGLDADLLNNNALCVRRATKWVALVFGTDVGLLVVLVSPELRATANHQLTRGPDSARRVSSHGCWKSARFDN